MMDELYAVGWRSAGRPLQWAGSVFLVSACLLANWVPLRRAARAEPVAALRVE